MNWTPNINLHTDVVSLPRHDAGEASVLLMNTTPETTAQKATQWSTVPADAIGLCAMLVAVPMLSTMCYYIRLFAAFRGCATTLEQLHGQLDRNAMVVGVVAFAGWLAYATSQSQMSRLEKWIVLCSLAVSSGAPVAWAMMKQVRF